MQIDSSTLNRLVALGQSKGRLTTEDLADALPVGSMSADDVALVVVHLEDAGIPVELDEHLLADRPGRPPGEAGAFELTSPQAPARPSAPARADPGVLGDDAPPAPHPQGPGDRPARSVHTAVVLAGLVVLGLLMLAVFLMRA